MSYLSCRLCEKCRRVKHLINLYGDDVYFCLEECLVRDRTKQSFKINKINKNGLEIDNSNDRVYKKAKIQVIDDSSYKHVTDKMMNELTEKLTKL